ncbi:MAG: 1-deoxy-D-xylulose-5-phosphate reductoisomerase, partial [Clostridia bacterium]
MRHTIAVLGSTGSIGTQALQVARHLGLSVAAATGCQNEKLLAEQCREFKIKKAWISEKKYSSLKILLADTDTKVVTGEDSLCELAEQTKCDVMLNSLLGISGLKPTLAAINGKQYIALANKETLVAGGSIVMKKAADNKVKIIPVDSEHSAIFQCLGKKKAKKILLTASGGS